MQVFGAECGEVLPGARGSVSVRTPSPPRFLGGPLQRPRLIYQPAPDPPLPLLQLLGSGAQNTPAACHADAPPPEPSGAG